MNSCPKYDGCCCGGNHVCITTIPPKDYCLYMNKEVKDIEVCPYRR